MRPPQPVLQGLGVLTCLTLLALARSAPCQVASSHVGAASSIPDPSSGQDQSPPANRFPEEVLSVRLELDLPGGCGSLSGFVERLRARIDRIHFVEIDANRVVRARIESTPDGAYRATMTLGYPDGHSSSRIVDANSCSDAIEALALITAVTLDPLSGSPEAAANEQAGARTRTGSVEQTQRKSSSAPFEQRSSSDHSRSAAAMSQGTQRTETNPTITSSPHRIGFAVGAGFSSFRGPSPGFLNGVEVGVGVNDRSQNHFALAVRLGFAYAVNAGVAANGGVADFSIASAVLDLCPWQQLWAAVELRACGAVQAGFVMAEGRATQAPETHRRPVLALGTSGQITWVPWDALALPVRAHLAFPTSRDTFAFDPEAFYRVPAVSYNLTAGLEARFR